MRLVTLLAKERKRKKEKEKEVEKKAITPHVIAHFALANIYSLVDFSCLCCRSLYGQKAAELPERTNEMAGVYAAQCVAVAKELGVPSINLWSKMLETTGWQKKFLRLAKLELLL